jgi:hypothetical protein
MRAHQREPCHVVIEHDFLPPARLVVTLLAPHAHLSLVNIILLMTGDAICCQFVAVEITAVARVAFHGSVLATQREFRCLCVVKGDLRPLAWPVTRLTLGAIPSLMLVLEPMAGNACCSGAFVNLRSVAREAHYLAMRSFQRKRSLGMVERLCFPPDVNRMAGLASLPEASFVRFARPMAVYASGRSRPILGIGLVATIATHCCVRAHERKIGDPVIERL